MYRCSVTRFCRFLSEKGLVSFSEITADHISCFNIADYHSTVEGKNAYNVRIRKFLQFIERKGIIPFGLHQALLCQPSVHKDIVDTLTDEEKQEIKHKHENARTPVELRNRAIMLLD